MTSSVDIPVMSTLMFATYSLLWMISFSFYWVLWTTVIQWSFILFFVDSVRARRLKLDRVLEYIMDNSADREVWDMADQGKKREIVP